MQVMIKTIDNGDYTVYIGSEQSFIDYIKEYAKEVAPAHVDFQHMDDKWELATQWNQYAWDTDVGAYFSFHDTEDLQ